MLAIKENWVSTETLSFQNLIIKTSVFVRTLHTTISSYFSSFLSLCTRVCTCESVLYNCLALRPRRKKFWATRLSHLANNNFAWIYTRALDREFKKTLENTVIQGNVNLREAVKFSEYRVTRSSGNKVTDSFVEIRPENSSTFTSLWDPPRKARSNREETRNVQNRAVQGLGGAESIEQNLVVDISETISGASDVAIYRMFTETFIYIVIYRQFIFTK